MNNLLEKIPVRVFPDETNELSTEIAKIISETIQANNKQSNKTVLGLATGHTPLDVYRELVKMHKEQGLSFANVVTFNLDEYYGLNPKDERSYYSFMQKNLFNYIDIKQENINIPNGLVSKSDISEYCSCYEQKILKSGGIDIQILGIGRDGHIGFNEPGSSIISKTRIVDLDPITRKDALSDFGEMQYVPKQAITMGIATILSAKKIILIARGEHKAKIIKEVTEGAINEKIAASFLQKHQNAVIFTDTAAASDLTRFKTPWVLDKKCLLDEKTAERALCSLSKALKKPLFQMKPLDFKENQMAELLKYHNIAELSEKIKTNIQKRIKKDDELPFKKTILVFSPHPDDDVIALTGIIKKLLKNQNKVISVYMTPGYNAVFDHVVSSFIQERKKFNEFFGLKDDKEAEKICKNVLSFLMKKKNSTFGLMDTSDVLNLKTIIRMVEAISACELLGIQGYEFLEMPFYRTGGAKKMPITEQDIKIVLELLNKYKPDIIFAASDLNDPNGTHRLCLSAIKQALEGYNNRPRIWYYRGAWQEFHPLEIDVFVPLTSDELFFKRLVIFRHESQKDPPPLPGSNNLEFWQRAETKNKTIAELLKTYGIGDYFALEVFQVNDGHRTI